MILTDSQGKIQNGLKSFLEEKLKQYNRPGFIPNDPISIPHLFSKKQDIEIAGFFAATLAWGQRVTIINKCRELMELMDNSPYEFVLGHTDKDLKRLLHFKHRTFNPTDLLYFIHFFRKHYLGFGSLEDAFLHGENMKERLVNFNKYFFSFEAPRRTQKHVATPARNSACKRLNMFLRWMVRSDDQGVDFGIWSRILPSELMAPMDVHVGRVSRQLGLVQRPQTDWKTTIELTERLREMDPADPIKYDLALFGIGIEERTPHV